MKSQALTGFGAYDSPPRPGPYTSAEPGKVSGGSLPYVQPGESPRSCITISHSLGCVPYPKHRPARAKPLCSQPRVLPLGQLVLFGLGQLVLFGLPADAIRWGDAAPSHHGPAGMRRWAQLLAAEASFLACREKHRLSFVSPLALLLARFYSFTLSLSDYFGRGKQTAC